MIMPFIKDDVLFKAVSFASSMIKKGKSVPLACRISASYYKINDSDVASEMGKRGALVSNYHRKHAK